MAPLALGRPARCGAVNARGRCAPSSGGLRVVAPARLRLAVVASADSNGAPKSDDKAAKPSADEPIWVRREKQRAMEEKEGGLPWPLYLIGSTLVAIAAVGCIFEFHDGNAFFGLIQPDSPLWAPILISLAVTGFPVAGFMFYKGVTLFNEAAERQDRLDGYID